MFVITKKELKENLTKYLNLAVTEEIEVKLDNKHSVFLCAKSNSMLLKTESFFALLPNEVLDDEDISGE